MIVLDGSLGEGGGQIVRTALTLALLTGKPLRLEKIRAGRKNPGLQRQHLTAVRAAAEISRAEVHGADLGAKKITFIPGAVRPGEYRFSVGTAGSTTLVLQTVLPALLTAAGPSTLVLEGGTHNPWAPPVDFLEHAFLPIVGRMGPRIEMTLHAHGFYPAGGGRLEVRIEPAAALVPIALPERGPVVQRRVRAIVSRLPRSIAEREVRTVLQELDWPDDCGTAEEVASPGPGNAVSIEVQCEHAAEVFTGFGRRGVPAETVAREAAAEARRWLAAGVPVGEHLADQLLLPLALAGGGSFRTVAPSLHTRTNIEVIQRFLDVRFVATEIADDVWEIAVVARE